MEMKEINYYCGELEWFDVTEDAPECGKPVIIKSAHSYPMVAFRCVRNETPDNCFYSPAVRNGYIANVKWRPLEGVRHD